MVGSFRPAMGHVELLNNLLDQAPENLVAFLDGRTSSFLEIPEPEPERPKKRRRLTESNTSQTPPAGPDDYLTLARVDISMVRLRSYLVDCMR